MNENLNDRAVLVCPADAHAARQHHGIQKTLPAGHSGCHFCSVAKKDRASVRSPGARSKSIDTMSAAQQTISKKVRGIRARHVFRCDKGGLSPYCSQKIGLATGYRDPSHSNGA